MIAEHQALAEHRDLAVAELERLRLDRDELETHRGTLHSQLEQLRADHDRLRAELDQALREREQRDAELAEVRNALGHLDPAQAAALIAEHQALAEHRDLAVAELERLRLDRDELETHRGTLHSQLEQLRADHDRLRAELDQALREREQRDAELAEVRNALGHLDPAQAAGLIAEHQALAEHRDLAVAELERLRLDRDELETHRGTLHSQLEQLRADHDRLRAELDQALRERERRDAELAEVRNALGHLDPTQAASLIAEHQALEMESAGLRDQLRAIQDQLSTQSGLTELVAQREGELQEARCLERAAPWTDHPSRADGR